jgi:1-acyl-sn-glycerol-3-phosphate acyltransferase
MMRAIVHGLLRLWLLVLLAGLGLMSLLWNLMAALLHPLLPAARATVLGRAAIAYGYRLYWACTRAGGMMWIDARALDALRHEPGGLIIAANHPSLLDALAIVARLPRSVCIMKAGLMRNVFLGAGARLARYISNESPRHMMRAAVDALAQGGQLILFPEGTRSEGGQMNRFRPGITSIAHRAGVPIQTVIIETASPYLGKGWPLWRLPPIPIVFRLRLGQRFAPNPDSAAALAELEAYFRRELGAAAPPAASLRAVE